MTEDEAIAELLQDGSHDYLSLDEVVWAALGDDMKTYAGGNGQPSQKARSRVLAVLGRLYRERLAVPGDLAESGFENWPGTADEWLARSEADLDRFGWPPMGAAHWLANTAEGDATASAAREG